MPDGTERSSGAVGVRSTPRACDVAGTHNGLRSHGRCRCLVISRIPVARLPLYTYRRRLGNVETRGPLAKRAVKQRGAKNGESENPETKSRGPRAQPPWLHAAPRASFPNGRIREHVGGGITSYKRARYDDTLLSLQRVVLGLCGRSGNQPTSGCESHFVLQCHVVLLGMSSREPAGTREPC